MEGRQRAGLFLIWAATVSSNLENKMRKYKYLAVAFLICLAVASFFLPYKFYYSWFILTSDHKTYERILDVFVECSIEGKIDLLVVFSPVIAVIISRTWVAKSITGLLFVSLLSTWMLLSADFGLRFALFEAYTKYLAGYFLFFFLSISGCVAFWAMTICQAWNRIRHWRLKLKTA